MYLAVQERIYKFYAVKILEKREELFSKESMELWKRLSHPGLPEIVDVVEEETRICLVMEYVEGKNLGELLETGYRLSYRQVLGWGIQICGILEYLHGQNPPIIFGDLKPSNLVWQRERIILVDLGSALMQNSRGRKSGTKEYLPVWREKEDLPDVETDIYGLGKTLECLMKAGRIRIPSQMRKLIDKCVSEKREERFSEAAQCRAVLERLWNRRYLLGMMLVLTVCVITAAGRTLQKEEQARDTRLLYTNLVQTAGESRREEKKRLLLEAIRLDPACATGYLDYLDCLLEDSVLTEQEDEELCSLLSSSYGDGISQEERLRENGGSYGITACRIGMAYWYFYRGESGKRYAVNWFRKALEVPEAEFGEELGRRRCRIYEKIGSYRIRLEHGDKTGEYNVSFRAYWEDLMELGDMPERSGEEIVRLYFWQELLCQILHYRMEFEYAGVTVEEMKGVAKNISEKMEEIGEESRVVLERKEKIREYLSLLEEEWVKKQERVEQE